MNLEASLLNETPLNQKTMSKNTLYCAMFKRRGCIGKLLSEFEGIDFTADILVVNDGSDDKTVDVAKCKNTPFLSLCSNLGVGGQYKLDSNMVSKMVTITVYRSMVMASIHLQNLKSFSTTILRLFLICLLAVDTKKEHLFAPAQYAFRNKSCAFTINTLFPGHNITDPTSGLRCMNKRAIEFFSNLSSRLSRTSFNSLGYKKRFVCW